MSPFRMLSSFSVLNTYTQSKATRVDVALYDLTRGVPNFREEVRPLETDNERARGVATTDDRDGTTTDHRPTDLDRRMTGYYYD